MPITLEPRAVARVLGGVVTGRNNISAPGPGHSPADRSLSVKIDPDAPEYFLVHSFAGDPPMVCRDYVRGKLGLPQWNERGTRNKVVHAVSRRRNQEVRPTIAFASQRWAEARDPRGTIVQRYLSSRPEHLPLSDDLAGSVIRYHSNLFYKEKTIWTGGMLALLRDVLTNEPCGVHRTFLDNDGRKLGRKMLGRAQQTAVKLDPNDSVTFGLVIGEGIETCLAARLAGLRPVWCLGSAGGIEYLPILAGIDAVTILAEYDAKGANKRAVDVCAKRWRDAGREVFIVEPLIGKDFADAWAEAQR